jgi:Phosphotransferase enzyme family
VTLVDALSGRAGIHGVHWILGGVEPQDAVHRALGGLLQDGHSLARCELYRAKFKPGRKLRAWYRIEVDGLGGRGVRHAAVTWFCDDTERVGGSGPVALFEHEAADRGLLAPFHSLHSHVPAWRMHALVSPLDWRFPALVRMSDPAYVAGVLAGPRGGTRPAVVCVRYRPGERHVLRYQPAGSPDGAAVIVKLYPDAESAVSVWRRATAVSDALEANAGGIRAVRPRALLADEHAVLHPVVAAAPEVPEPARLHRLGAELRRFHAAPATWVEPSAGTGGFDDEAAAVLRAGAHVDALLPRVAASMRTTLEGAVAAARELPEENGALIHGDCKLDHFLVSGEELMLIDLDRSRPGDPALDVGKLAADVRWRVVTARRSGAERAVRALLDGYFNGAMPARYERARLYESMMMLKIAARRPPLFDRSWATLTTELVAGAADVLERAGSGDGLPSRRPRLGAVS